MCSVKSQDEQASVLIICYGNPLRGDDGLGLVAASLLRKSFTAHQAQVIYCHQLTPELAEPIGSARLVIFIDACKGGAPGAMECHQLHRGEGRLTLDHTISPEGLIELSAELYGGKPLAYAVTVAGEFWGFSRRLSPKVAGAIPKLITGVRKLASVRHVGSNAEANHA